MNRTLLIALAAIALPLAACASDEPDTTVIVDDQPQPSTVVVDPMPADPVVVDGPDVIVEQPAVDPAPMPAPADTMAMPQ